MPRLKRNGWLIEKDHVQIFPMERGNSSLAQAMHSLTSIEEELRNKEARMVSLKIHNILDYVAGVILLLAPTLIGYRAFLTTGQYGLHFALGMGVIGLVALTQNKTVDVSTSDASRPAAAGMRP